MIGGATVRRFAPPLPQLLAGTQPPALHVVPDVTRGLAEATKEDAAMAARTQRRTVFLEMEASMTIMVTMEESDTSRLLLLFSNI